MFGSPWEDRAPTGPKSRQDPNVRRQPPRRFGFTADIESEIGSQMFRPIHRYDTDIRAQPVVQFGERLQAGKNGADEGYMALSCFPTGGHVEQVMGSPPVDSKYEVERRVAKGS